MFATANRERFVRWLRGRLLPKPRRGDVLVMDNATPHHAPQVANLCKAAGVSFLYLPPYSPDFNPIEPGWALQKQHVRRHAPGIHVIFGVSPGAPGTESRSAIVALVCSFRVPGWTQLIHGFRAAAEAAGQGQVHVC
jgi:hypothetical protein